MYRNKCKVCGKLFDFCRQKSTCSKSCFYNNLSRKRKLQQFNKWLHLIPNISLEELFNKTSFLHTTALIPERVYCLLNDIRQVPKCRVCGSSVKFRHSPNWQYAPYCSSSCCNSDIYKIEKVKTLLQNKYGVISTSQLPNMKSTSKKTCLERFGTPNPMQNVNIKNKCISNRIKKHGDLYCPNIGNNEESILNYQELNDGCTINRKFRIGMYNPDGYCKETNTIYEVYEQYHKSAKQKLKDTERQKYIQDKLKCTFVIIWDGLNKPIEVYPYNTQQDLQHHKP